MELSTPIKTKNQRFTVEHCHPKIIYIKHREDALVCTTLDKMKRKTLLHTIILETEATLISLTRDL